MVLRQPTRPQTTFGSDVQSNNNVETVTGIWGLPIPNTSSYPTSSGPPGVLYLDPSFQRWSIDQPFGDVFGTYPNLTVQGFGGIGLSAMTPLDGQGWFYSSGVGNYVLQGTSAFSGGSSPTGPAGGDLSGTYPNPTVSKINGAALGTTTATNGNILIGSGNEWNSELISGVVTATSAGVFSYAKNPEWEFLSTSAATAGDSSLSFTSIDNSTYKSVKFVMEQVTPNTDTDALEIQFYLNGSLKTDGSYSYALSGFREGGVSLNGQNSSVTNIILASSMFKTSASNNYGEVIIPSINNSSVRKYTMGNFSYLVSSGGTGHSGTLTGSGQYFGATTALDGVKFLFSTGTISSMVVHMFGRKY